MQNKLAQSRMMLAKKSFKYIPKNNACALKEREGLSPATYTHLWLQDPPFQKRFHLDIPLLYWEGQ